jgi:hypothetical protein
MSSARFARSRNRSACRRGTRCAIRGAAKDIAAGCRRKALLLDWNMGAEIQ